MTGSRKGTSWDAVTSLRRSCRKRQKSQETRLKEMKNRYLVGPCPEIVEFLFKTIGTNKWTSRSSVPHNAYLMRSILTS